MFLHLSDIYFREETTPTVAVVVLVYLGDVLKRGKHPVANCQKLLEIPSIELGGVEIIDIAD